MGGRGSVESGGKAGLNSEGSRGTEKRLQPDSKAWPARVRNLEFIPEANGSSCGQEVRGSQD